MKFQVSTAVGGTLCLGLIGTILAAPNWIPPGGSESCGKVDEEVLSEAAFPFTSLNVRGLYPWQITIHITAKNFSDIYPSQFCSGSIIDSWHILTAATCLNGHRSGFYDFIAAIGSFNRTATDPQEQRISINSKNIHIYQDLDLTDHNFDESHDIAVARLDSEIQFNKYVQSVCLPSKELEYNAGTNCTVAGWGSLSAYDSDEEALDTPQAVQVPIVDPQGCTQFYATWETYPNATHMFCTGGDCWANTGAPVVCEIKEDNRVYRIQYGIHSFKYYKGDVCNSASPVVNTKLVYYLDWIQDVLSQSNKQITKNSPIDPNVAVSPVKKETAVV